MPNFVKISGQIKSFSIQGLDFERCISTHFSRMSRFWQIKAIDHHIYRHPGKIAEIDIKQLSRFVIASESFTDS